MIVYSWVRMNYYTWCFTADRSHLRRFFFPTCRPWCSNLLSLNLISTLLHTSMFFTIFVVYRRRVAETLLWRSVSFVILYRFRDPLADNEYKSYINSFFRLGSGRLFTVCSVECPRGVWFCGIGYGLCCNSCLSRSSKVWGCLPEHSVKSYSIA